MGGEEDPNSKPARWVRYVGQKLISESDAHVKNPYPFKFHLLKDPKTINAFALPGGQVFITRALYDRLRTEAELAGVLGHEITHVIERHSAQQMAKQNMTQSLVMGAGVAASGDQDHPNRGQAVMSMAAVAGQLMNLSYSREDESEADNGGLKWMTQAGYDPNGMRKVMEILQKVSGGGKGGPPEFMQTHPDPGHRLDDIDAWIKKTYAGSVPPTLTPGHPLSDEPPIR